MKLSRAIKARIRRMVAAEIRERLSEPPETLSDDPPGIIEAWPQYVREIARQIQPED